MNLTFPTALLFPAYPTRPTDENEAAVSAFLDALKDFFQHLQQQNASTGRYFEAVGCYVNDNNQECILRTNSTKVGDEAISAMIRNINPPVRREYVWDPTQNRWVVKVNAE